MSLSWFKRKARLATLLKSQGDEDADGLALDRLLHGQSVIGKTLRTTEIDAIRFQDKDLEVVGTLEYGQFGVIDVVNCHLDGRVYVRKSIEKRFALRTRDQCSPQFERDILVQAVKTDSKWAPHLLCAFQTPTHLNLVMDYAECGTLWDVLESSPHDGKVPEDDLKWWAPQIVSAIHWCHSQGFVHRDIKPHNFVLTRHAHVLLIDFGSAAPLLPPGPDGSQFLAKRYCLVPCGTCDYISPEILRTHEEALVEIQMEEDEVGNAPVDRKMNGYGRETDWWSLGAMLYEMAYGVAPFFAKDIRQTYLRIMDHEKSLRFNQNVSISAEYQHLLRRLLTHAEHRIGRQNIMEITDHPVFNGVDWMTLSARSPPPNLHLPQFTYSDPAGTTNGPPSGLRPVDDESHSQPFAFSTLFQSSKSLSPGLSILHSTRSMHASLGEDNIPSFIGFSWGPTQDSFPDLNPGVSNQPHYPPPPANLDTTRQLQFPFLHLTPNSLLVPPGAASTPVFHSNPFATPNRPSTMTPYQTLPRASTIRRTAMRRAVSDREAMKQLVDCVGMSARKKVLESGRKSGILAPFSRSGTLKKELRFLPSPASAPDHGSSSQSKAAPTIITAVSSGSEDTDSEGPPSPSPRPGSAMSMMSRRSGTPTVTGTFSQRNGLGMTSSNNTMLLNLPSVGHTSSSLNRYTESTGTGSLPSPTFEDSTLDKLEENYDSIMDDILTIEERLGHLSILMDENNG